MDCTQTRNYMHGHLDRELDPVTATAIEQHLQSCAACRQAYDQQSSLKAAIKRHAAYYTAPGDLADRIRAKADKITGNRPKTTGWPRWQWLNLVTAVAVTAAVTWIAALQLRNPSNDEIIAEQVVAGHARSVLTGHLADVASSDQHTVKPWLSSKLDFSPPVTDLTSAGFPLVGGRLEYLDKRPVAALVYGHRQHLINLFVWPDPKARNATPMRTLSKHGYHLLHWTDAGMTFWAISDLNPAEITTFAETYASARSAPSQ
jgi:mycothiol system anti-sigma-R factor